MEEEIIRLTTEEEIRAIAAETFIKNTSSVNKVSPNSVLSGFIAGNAKIGKKALKDIKLAVSQLYPSSASGAALDRAARDYGISTRFGSNESSVIVRFIANPGTVYPALTTTVTSDNGVVYNLQEEVTIGGTGFAYGSCRSQNPGIDTIVRAFEITIVLPEPSGHVAITNEYESFGGRDAEDDETYRTRILAGANLFAQGTIAKLTQVLLNINTNILRIFYRGTNNNGKIRIAIASQNGALFSQAELDQLLEEGGDFFSLSELNPTNTNSYGVELVNVEYQYINVDFRIELFDNFNIVNILRDVQPRYSKLVDFRNWIPGISKVEWDDLLSTLKGTRGVKNVPDRFFLPNNDILIDSDKLPRFRGFIARDIDGNILLDQTGVINPIFYPEIPNQSFISTAIG
jgi:hypothetical protein